MAGIRRANMHSTKSTDVPVAASNYKRALRTAWYDFLAGAEQSSACPKYARGRCPTGGNCCAGLFLAMGSCGERQIMAVSDIDE